MACSGCSVLHGVNPNLKKEIKIKTVDFPTVVSDRIARAFNRSGAIQAVALYISKAFERL